MAISVGLPVVVLIFTDNFEALAGLYAIGVVGADICVNLGSCSFNSKIEMHWIERAMMGATFSILIAVELTLAKTKHEALFFVICVLVVGLFLWAYSQRLSGTRTLTVTKEFADIVKPEVVEEMSQMSSGAQKILVFVRGLTRCFGLPLTRPRCGMPPFMSWTSVKLRCFTPAALFQV